MRGHVHEEAKQATTSIDAYGGRLLRLPDVRRATGMSKGWIYGAIVRGAFPAQLRERSLRSLYCCSLVPAGQGAKSTPTRVSQAGNSRGF